MNTSHYHFPVGKRNNRILHFTVPVFLFLFVFLFFNSGLLHSQNLSRAQLDNLNNWAESNFFKWNLSERIAMTDSILNICSVYKDSNPIPYIAALNKYSSALWWDNRIQESLEMVEMAYQTIQPFKDSSLSLLSEILNNRGATYEKIGLTTRAKEDFEKAITINHRIGLADSIITVYPLWNLGDLYADTGKHELSRDSYEKALQILHNTVGPTHDNYAIGLQKLAKFYNLIGMYDKALEYGLQARDITAQLKGKDNYSYATRLRFIAIFYENLGEYEKSRTCFEEATEIVQKVFGKDHPTYAFYSMHIASALKHLGYYRESHALFTEAKEVIEGIKNKNLHDLYLEFLMDGMASLYGRTNELERADTALQVTLQLAKERYVNGSSKFYANRVENYAKCLEELDNYEKAFNLYQESDAIWHRQIEAAFGVLNEYESEQLLKKLASSFNKYRCFAHKYHDKLPATTTLVYNDALALKSLLLQKSTTVFSSILESGDEQLNIDFRTWRNKKELLAALQNQPSAGHDFDQDSLQQIVDRLERKLVVRSAPFRSSITSVNWRDVQEALQPGEAAIEFIRYPSSAPNTNDSNYYAALILTRETELPAMVLLCHERELAEHLHQKLYPFQRYLHTIYSNKLYDLVWAPMAPYLRDVRKIYFSPDGLLHRLSFPAIPQTDSTRLSDRYRLEYVSSTRNLSIGKEEVRWNSALLFGDINYDSTSVPVCEDASRNAGAVKILEDRIFDSQITEAQNNRETYWTDRGWSFIEDESRSFNFNQLIYTEKEIEAIATLLDKASLEVTIARGQFGSEECFKSFGRSNNSPTIINLATHGYFFSDNSTAVPDTTLPDLKARERIRQSSNPLFRSGLALAGANLSWEKGIFHENKEDGILTAYEISNLNLTGTRLAVLSACQTGLGDIRGSEGVYGLQRGFKMAGVDYLLVTLWNIRDGKETVEFITTFYDKLLAGQPVKQAFYQTQETMKERYKDPYFWAGFELID